jgi:hypothetical protein
MYALQKRKDEWELKNELLLEQLKANGVGVLSFIAFVLWRIGNGALHVLMAIFRKPKLMREVGPGELPEEIDERKFVRLYEQGPMVR